MEVYHFHFNFLPFIFLSNNVYMRKLNWQKVFLKENVIHLKILKTENVIHPKNMMYFYSVKHSIRVFYDKNILNSLFLLVSVNVKYFQTRILK